MIQNNIKQILPNGLNIEFTDNAALFEVSKEQIKSLANKLRLENKLPLKLITATDERTENGCFKIWYVFGWPEEKAYVVPFLKVKENEDFPSLFPEIHEAWNFERKIKTFFGLTPSDHPDQRPIILHEDWPENLYPLRKDFDYKNKPAKAEGNYKFNQVEGEGIYEIPVGPIHAGIIEPGHFRFSVAGEDIVALEARLGYVHKGTEKLFENFSLEKSLLLSEKISGDSSFSHSLAFCQAIEKLSGMTPSKRAEYLRVIFAELERIANHLGDIGAIMVDVGFNFGGANGARLREMVMQIHERLSGNRYLRGVNTFGGVTKDLNQAQIDQLILDLDNIKKDFAEVIEIANNSASMLNRLITTGRITQEIALSHGATGVGARATGVAIDTRAQFPYAAYGDLKFKKIQTEDKGDVYARFTVRIKEVLASIELIKEAARTIPAGPLKKEAQLELKKNSVVLTAVEGWRGEILYLVKTDNQGKIDRVVPRDPSFLNWPLMSHAVLGNIVPDFPVINKSFNLSYSGNDL